MPHRRPQLGTVLEVSLPDGRFAYGRLYRDAAVCFYGEVSTVPGHPPLGNRDFIFCVGIYDDAVNDWPIVGMDSFLADEDSWPPPSGIIDPISGNRRVYHRGQIRDAEPSDGAELEPAAVWDKHHIIDRLLVELAPK